MVGIGIEKSKILPGNKREDLPEAVIAVLGNRFAPLDRDQVRVRNPLSTAASTELDDVQGTVSAIDAVAVNAPLGTLAKLDPHGNVVITNLLSNRQADHVVTFFRRMDDSYIQGLAPPDTPKTGNSEDVGLILHVRIPALRPGESRRVHSGSWSKRVAGPGEDFEHD